MVLFVIKYFCGSVEKNITDFINFAHKFTNFLISKILSPFNSKQRIHNPNRGEKRLVTEWRILQELIVDEINV